MQLVHTQTLLCILICLDTLQILEAVAYMHEHGIMHRDVKPENIMFAQSVETSQDNPDSDQVFNVKMIDLGMAALYNPKVPLRGRPAQAILCQSSPRQLCSIESGQIESCQNLHEVVALAREMSVVAYV